jgi:hypothetical protein
VGIERNIEVRKTAELVFSLLEDSAGEIPDERDRRRYWGILLKLVGDKIPQGRELAESCRGAMDDQESRQFGRLPMPFGEYRGRPVDEVPLDRLEWYATQQFIDDLRRYLRSRRVVAENSDR